MRRPLLIVALALGIGCDGSEQESPATTSPPSTRSAPPSSSTTTPAANAPPTTVGAPTTPEEARRLLEQHGIDPDRLSRDIAEQMRHRFDPQPAP